MFKTFAHIMLALLISCLLCHVQAAEVESSQTANLVPYAVTVNTGAPLTVAVLTDKDNHRVYSTLWPTPGGLGMVVFLVSKESWDACMRGSCSVTSYGIRSFLE